jgi:RNA polymerase sigma-70 factor (ECF subfamily)
MSQDKQFLLRPVKAQDGQGSGTFRNNAPKTSTAEHDRLLLTELTEMSRNLRGLPPEDALDKLANEISLMTSAEVSSYYHLLLASGNAGTLVRGVVEQAAEQYRMNQQPVPMHLMDALRITRDEHLSFGHHFWSFDDAYIQQLRDGDPSTMSHFVAYFDRLLRSSLLARRVPAVSIDDLVQETFRLALIAVREGTIREPQRLGAYIYGICKIVLREYNRTRATIQTELNLARFYEDLPDPKEEKLTKVQQVLAMMPKRDRELLQAIMRDEHGDDLARQYGVDREYIRILVHRATELFISLKNINTPFTKK